MEKNMEKPRILVLSGPNLNMLGKRNISIYKEDSLDTIHERLGELADELGLEVVCVQKNTEGDMIDWLQRATDEFKGVIINAGAYAHYSYALRSAIGSSMVPCIEVCMSNIYTREEFRHKSVIAAVCEGVIVGFGSQSYMLALKAMAQIVNKDSLHSNL